MIGGYRLVLGALATLPLTTTAACTAIVRRRARTRVETNPDLLSHHKVGLVLGAGVLADGRPSNLLYDRVRAGCDLLDRGTVDTLLLSGDGNGSRGHSEVAVMHEVATGLGATSEQLLQDPEGLSTLASCRRAREEFHLTELIIVTQRFHAKRTAYLSQQCGLTTTVFAIADRSKYGRLLMAPIEGREVLAQTKAVLLSRSPRALLHAVN